MTPEDSILAAWATSNRVTIFLVESLPFGDLGLPRAGDSPPHDPIDRGALPQQPLRLDPDARLGSPCSGAGPGRSVPGDAARSRARPRAQRRGHGTAAPAGHRKRRQPSAIVQVRLAQPPAGRRARALVLRRARRAPSRPARARGPAARPSPPGVDHGGPLGLEAAVERGEGLSLEAEERGTRAEGPPSPPDARALTAAVLRGLAYDSPSS